jgi:hypothetical protein
MAEAKTLREIAADLKRSGTRCNCDLDNWQPELPTGHSWVCRIHEMAKAIYKKQPGKGATYG